MSRLVKVLLGAATVAAVGAVVIVILDKKEEEESVKEVEGVGKVAQFNKDENPSVLKRIKRYVTKKVVKFLAWVALHMEQIEAAGAIIGFGSTILGIVKAIKDFKEDNELNEKVDQMNRRLEEYYKVYNYNRDVDDKNAQLTLDHVSRSIDRVLYNQNVLGYELTAVADKTGVDLDQMEQDLNEKFPKQEKIA